jgi:hypothetical protein
LQPGALPGADHEHDLQVGFSPSPSIGDPARTIAVARILDDLGFDPIGIHCAPYRRQHLDAMALIGAPLPGRGYPIRDRTPRCYNPASPPEERSTGAARGPAPPIHHRS